MTRYMNMPVGRVTVLLIYDSTGLLCVQRNKWDAGKLKLNRKWWQRAETFLSNSQQQPIEATT